MHAIRLRQRFSAVLGALIVLSLLVMPAMARHSWGKYHVPRPTDITIDKPIPLNVGDNVDATWDSYLGVAIDDWKKFGESGRISLNPVQGAAVGGAAICDSTEGKFEVCNYTYGSNGW